MKISSLLLAGAALFITTGASAQSTLTFDDIGVPNTVYPHYTKTGFDEMGFHFSNNVDVIDVSSGSTYAATGPAHSGNYVAFNDFGGALTMTKVGGGLFDATSFFVSGWYGSGAETADFYANGALVGASAYTFATGTYSKVAGFSNVDTIVFNGLSNSLILVDDVSIGGANAIGAVPEPATWAMMIIGVGAVGFAMRRRLAVSEIKFNDRVNQIAAGKLA